MDFGGASDKGACVQEEGSLDGLGSSHMIAEKNPWGAWQHFPIFLPTGEYPWTEEFTVGYSP